MLKEFERVRQNRGDRPRRWFCDENFDLVVWYAEDGEIYGFQLCYDADRRPRAFTWRRSYGLYHEAIDNGDEPIGSINRSAVLVPDGKPDIEAIVSRFNRASAQLPDEIRSLVSVKIREFPETG